MDQRTRRLVRRAGRGRPPTQWVVGQIVVGLIILGTLITGSLWVARGQRTGASGGETATQPAAVTAIPTPPKTTAKSMFALDVTSGQPRFALNADQHRAPASLAKMAGGLVVVHAIVQGLITVDDPVTIHAADVVDPNVYSHMGLVAGDTVTVEQLLYGALLPSGDDASRALARYVGAKLSDGDPGSGDPTAAFVQAMNQLAQSLDQWNTHFANPDGLDDPAQYTTARDLATLFALVSSGSAPPGDGTWRLPA